MFTYTKYYIAISKLEQSLLGGRNALHKNLLVKKETFYKEPLQDNQKTSKNVQKNQHGRGRNCGADIERPIATCFFFHDKKKIKIIGAH